MSPMVVNISEEELRARRDMALDSVGVSAEELHRREALGTLTGPEWKALETIDRVAFLLGES